MKISPAELKSITTEYELRIAVAKANCSPEEKAEICEFILNDNTLFQAMTPHIAGLDSFYEIFSTRRMDPKIDEMLFHKLVSSEESKKKFLNHYYGFNMLYKLFVRDDLRAEEKLTRCTALLQAGFAWITSNEINLAYILNIDPDMQAHILEWAEKNKIILSNQDRIAIINKAAELIETERKYQRHIAYENALKQITEKVARRFNNNRYFQPDPTRTALHQVVSMMGPGDADTQRAISLIEQGADLEARDKNGETPLISAAIAGNTMMTLMLLSRGAKASVVDNNGYKPKLFKLFYDCDHEYDEGGCIPLKRFMDNPVRHLLEKIEGLESSYLSPENKSYSLDAIKEDLLSIMHDAEFQDANKLTALCGYVFNHVRNEDRVAVYHFFKDNCKIDISRQTDFLTSNSTAKSLSALAAYREQMHGNRVIQHSADIDIQAEITALMQRRHR